ILCNTLIVLCTTYLRTSVPTRHASYLVLDIGRACTKTGHAISQVEAPHTDEALVEAQRANLVEPGLEAIAPAHQGAGVGGAESLDRKSKRLNSSHVKI